MKSALMKAGLLAGVFFPLLVTATSFGPIPLVDQAEHSQYVVRGRVAGASWVEPAENSQPYTFWRVQVSHQHKGRTLGSEIVVRQPGGEIGDRGYHVAGTASFAAGEDTFILLRDTPQNAQTKEVVSLAAGKYLVETAPNGKQKVVSGLGLPVTGTDGNLLSPEEFADLIERVARKEPTTEDRSIFINHRTVHEAEENTAGAASTAPQTLDTRRSPQRSPAEAESTKVDSPSPVSTTESHPNPVQQSSAPAEEPSTGSSKSWIFALLIVLGLVAGLVLVLRR